MKPKTSKSIPYEFVLEYLGKLLPHTRPMFGCTAVYLDDKIVCILRRKEGHVKDNGVWMATTIEHHDSLRKDFPKMRSISVFGTKVTSWQLLPEDARDFEESVTKMCDLILARDPRIGKIPNAKKKKTKRVAKEL